ncbi:MAG TPA: creatininase family protein, partial [Myxococcaceae bacterium]|nr:creatininase family protein [Myxococcaceae bacterium]
AEMSATHGVLLEDLTWVEAERALTPQTLILLPLGAAAKEHGPHLKLKNDLILAEYFKKRIQERTEVVIAPTVTYHFYPAFLEYPGSTSLRLETARDLVVDICRSLARHGPRRFYVLNTGISTVRALAPAAEQLAKEGILLRYTDLHQALIPIEKEIAQQPGGSHADEIETSMILAIDPVSVDMNKAARDFEPNRPGPLTRRRDNGGAYSPSGVWGDATLASPEKGEKILKAVMAVLLRDLDELRAAQLP